MTKKEALKLLKGGPEGIAEWNRRRAEGARIPSLSEADLSQADLHGVDLHRAYLYRAYLSGANLSEANLREADLSAANLCEADLRGVNLVGADLLRAHLSVADLTGANLSKADLLIATLRDANLTGANLSGANLGGANLSGADLTGADLGDANLSDANLRDANLRDANLRGADFTYATAQDTVFACDLNGTLGLDEMRHDGPSYVAISTALSFKNDLPESFLRGCGLRDEEIAYFRGQVGKPFRFYKCFISYSSKDEAFATRLYNDFQGAGIRCWKWNEDARTGQNLWGEIDTAIRKFDKLVLIASESSLKSPYVADEVERAIQKEREREAKANRGEWVGDTNVLFPVRLDDYIINGWMHERRADVIKKVIADARGWDTDHAVYQRVLGKLVKDLKV